MSAWITVLYKAVDDGDARLDTLELAQFVRRLNVVKEAKQLQRMVKHAGLCVLTCPRAFTRASLFLMCIVFLAHESCCMRLVVCTMCHSE